MTMNFPAPRNGSVSREPRTEESRAHTGEDRELAHRWHEESKRRYEELAHQWLQLAERGSAAHRTVKVLSRVPDRSSTIAKNYSRGPFAASVTIPDAHLLFTADFKRKGSDLVLTGEDGHKVLVPDYFRHEKQPDLVSPEGALLSASLVELLSGSATPGQYAQAAAPAAQQPIGRVETVSGSATVTRNGVAVDLNAGDLVFQGDVVQTRSDSTLGIGFSDGSAFSMKENARMALNEFVYDPNGTSNSALINLVQGTVSFIAAQVAKTGNMRVDTPTATLGIRGFSGLTHVTLNGE